MDIDFLSVCKLKSRYKSQDVNVDALKLVKLVPARLKNTKKSSLGLAHKRAQRVTP